jgi:hypothetical protein
MHEAVSNVLYLLFDQSLLLLLDVELLLSVVLESQVIQILDKLLGNVLQTFEATCEKEEGFNVIIASLGYCSL